MNKLSTLLKYTLINKLNLNKLVKNKKKKSLVFVLLIFLISSLSALAFATFYMFIMGQALISIGAVELLILMGMSFGCMMCFITNIPLCESTLLHSRDYEMLSAMPISTKNIIISKFLSLFIINYGVIALLLFSSLIVVGLYSALTVPILLLSLVVFIFLPLIPLSLSALCSFAFSKLTARLKHKNIISMVLTLAFVIAIMFVSMSLKDIETDTSIDGYAYMLNVFKNMGYFPYLAFKGINGDYLSLLVYILISVAMFTVFFVLISKNYHKLNSDLKVTYKNDNFNLEKVNFVSSNDLSTFTLFKIEIKKYFSLSGYVLNTIIGPIMGTVMLVVLMMQGLDVTIIQLGGDSYLALVIVALVSFFSNISPTTSSTISLEGKSLWIYKSMPIETKKILTSKTLISIIVNLPFQIINGVLVVLFWGCNFYDFLFVVLIPATFSIAMSFIGIYLNLKFPRFDWDNPIKIVKNSISVLLTMVASFIIFFIAFVIGIVLVVLEVYVYLILAILLAITTIIMFISIKLLYSKGVQLYDGLSG